MGLVVEAYALRRAARRSLRNGRFAKAHQLASAAQKRCAAQAGKQLLLLTRWLTRPGCVDDWMGA